MTSTIDTSRFDKLVKDHELTPQVAQNLKEVLSTCDISVLCDDSGSMSSLVKEENADPFAPSTLTRWMELKRLVSVVIEFTTAINPNGISLQFLNRPGLENVTSTAGLQSVFSVAPGGGTPLSGALNRIYKSKINNISSSRQLLIVVVTDGEPSDSSNPETARNMLYNTLVNITSGGNVHVSFAECTDQEENTAYLDDWDGRITNYDNTDDYREELKRVKRAQGSKFKFDYNDYVIKILLATFNRWYFNLDQTKNRAYQPNNQVYQPNNQDCACVIL